MFFTIGIETPKQDNEAYGIVVPALCNNEYSCFSASDTQENIPIMATEAILLTISDMLATGKYNITDIKNNHMSIIKNTDFKDFDTWMLIDVNLSAITSKHKRINITLPDILINRIDNVVKTHGSCYKDRSNFLAQATMQALANLNQTNS